MKERDEPQFRIEGFSKNPQKRKKELEELTKKRDEIFKKLQEERKNKEIER